MSGNTGWFSFGQEAQKEKPKFALPKAIVLKKYGPYETIALVPMKELGYGAYVVFATEHCGDDAPLWKWRARPFPVVSGDPKSLTQKTSGTFMTTLVLGPDCDNIPAFDVVRQSPEMNEAREAHIRGWMRMLAFVEKQAENGAYTKGEMQVFANGTALAPETLDKEIVFAAFGLPHWVKVGDKSQTSDMRGLLAERIGAMASTARALEILGIPLEIDSNAWLQWELGPQTAPHWKVAPRRSHTPEALRLIYRGWLPEGILRHLAQNEEGIVPVTNDMRYQPLSVLAPSHQEEEEFDPRSPERDDYEEDEDDDGKKGKKKKSRR